MFNPYKVRSYQNIALRKITISPTCVSNHTYHSDLGQKSVQEEIKNFQDTL